MYEMTAMIRKQKPHSSVHRGNVKSHFAVAAQVEQGT